MNKAKRLTGIALATSAAALFLAAPLTSHAGSAGDMVKCAGVNTGKGKTFCKNPNNACKGQNSCKGSGIVPLPEKFCDAVGGKNIGPAGAKKG